MKITALTAQKQDKDRVNVMVDGKYRFSLSVFQVVDLGIKVGREYTESELLGLESESQFGKLYARTLEYCLMRPHSLKEVRDYLYKKTLTRRYKSRTGEIKQRGGVSEAVTSRVLQQLIDKGYVDDEKFARYWIENRNQRKGSSLRKLSAELSSKGVDPSIVESVLSQSDRNDKIELMKVLEKKRYKYDDEQKLMQYLARQGFSYDDIKSALADESE